MEDLCELSDRNMRTLFHAFYLLLATCGSGCSNNWNAKSTCCANLSAFSVLMLEEARKRYNLDFYCLIPVLSSLEDVSAFIDCSVIKCGRMCFLQGDYGQMGG